MGPVMVRLQKSYFTVSVHHTAVYGPATSSLGLGFGKCRV